MNGYKREFYDNTNAHTKRMFFYVGGMLIVFIVFAAIFGIDELKVTNYINLILMTVLLLIFIYFDNRQRKRGCEIGINIGKIEMLEEIRRGVREVKVRNGTKKNVGTRRKNR